MAHDFKLPDVGEGIEEAEVLKWMVDVGDRVREDDPVAEVETDKAIIEVPSPVSGRVKRFHAREGETVEIGETLVTFDDENGGNGDERDDRNSGVEILDSDGNAAVDVDADGGDDEKRMENDGGKPSTAATRRLAREIGVDLEDVEGSGEDGRVLPQDVLHAAKEEQDDREESRESDRDGDGEGGEDGAADGPGSAVPGKGEKTPAMEDDDATPEFGQGETPAVEPDTAEETTMFGDETPVAERTGEAETEEAEGVTETRSEQTGGLETAGSEGIFEESTAVEDETEVGKEEKDEEENGGDDEGHEETERTVETETTTDQENGSEEREQPLMTHHDVADAERLVEVRDAMDDSVDVRLTYTPLLVKACSEALIDHAVFVGDGEGSGDVNVGVAIEAGDSVAVPVVENADEKGVAEIAKEVTEAVGDARSGDVDETGEADFTLVNVGAVGGDGVSPVVDKPGVAAVSVGEIRQRPSVVDDEVVARHTAPLHLTFDGDVADIAEAARFTNDLKRYVSEPAVMLL